MDPSRNSSRLPTEPLAERRVYLDAAGSAPVLDAVAAELASLPFANPSSLHAEGRAARAALDRARDRAASALGVASADLVFCASGSEAVNLALLGAGRRLPRDARIVTWAAEHHAVLGGVRRLELEGWPVTVLPVDRAARAGAEDIPADAGLVSIGLANNELGTLQPVAEIIDRAREVGALIHVDACQGAAWLPPPAADADLLSLSGHKLGAGGGGLLAARRGVGLEPLLYGGPQERSRRAGREDVRSAVAMAVALEVCNRRREAESARLAPLMARLREALAGVGGELTGGEPRLPNFATAVFADRRGEDLLLALDLAGVAASSGSACASGSLDPSHVLLAAGYSLAAALGSLRLTAWYSTTAADVEGAETALAGLARIAAQPRNAARPARV